MKEYTLVAVSADPELDSQRVQIMPSYSDLNVLINALEAVFSADLPEKYLPTFEADKEKLRSLQKMFINVTLSLEEYHKEKN